MENVFGTDHYYASKENAEKAIERKKEKLRKQLAELDSAVIYVADVTATWCGDDLSNNYYYDVTNIERA